MLGRKSSRIAVALVALALTLAACGGGEVTGSDDPTQEGTEAPSDPGPTEDASEEGLYLDGELVIPQALLEEARAGAPAAWYTSINEARSQPIVDAFVEHTGIQMNLVRNNPDTTFERILSEAGAGVLGADVIALADVFVPTLAEEGIVVPHVVQAIDELDERFYAPDNSWYTLYSSPVLLAYNNQIVSEEEAPTAWADLAEPGPWQECGHGWLPADAGSTGWSLAMMTRQEIGEDFWQRHAAAGPAIYSGGSSMAQDLGRGEICVSPITGTTLGATIESGAPVSFVYPEEGTPLFDVMVGVTDAGPNPAAGKAFMNWATSRVGMQVAAPGYGAREDVPPPVVGPDPEHVLPTLSEGNFWKPTPEEFASLRDEWVPEWYEVYGYVPN